MVILAVETATRAGSQAVFTDAGPGLSVTGDPAVKHDVRLPGDLLAFVKRAGLTLAAIDVYAVVTGPGSFTGLRVGLAAVQGLALAGGKSVVGIPTLDAMVSGWLDAAAEPAGCLVACLDGARGDVFWCVYDVDHVRRIEDARAIMPARVSTPDAAATEIAELCRGRSLTLVGDGAERYQDTFLARLPAAPFSSSSPMPNLAAAAARLAARRLDEAGPPHALRPIYVRRPDAELARERARRAQAALVTCFEVRDAGDVAAVAELQARAFGEAWGPEALGGASDRPDVARLHAARLGGGEIVAYCAGWQIADELHINSFAVAPEHRRRGIARALLRHVLSVAAAGGVTAATLEVRDSNRPGRALYEGLGFQIEGVRRGYYQHPREDALILWLRALPAVARPGDARQDG